MAMVLVVALQMGISLALMAWVARRQPHSRIAWILASAAAAAWLVAGRLAGLWLWVPLWMPLALLLLLACSLVGGRRWLAGLPARPSGTRAWPELVGGAALLAAGLTISAAGVSGRRPPHSSVVPLTFPLRSGTYYVANGGSSDLLNAHLATRSSSRFAAWRGQSYGVDIISLAGMGLHA